MTRRDLAKFFAIGSVIAPVVGGEVVKDAAAKLVEVPKVEVVDPLAYEVGMKMPGNPPKVELWVNGRKYPILVTSVQVGAGIHDPIFINIKGLVTGPVRSLDLL